MLPIAGTLVGYATNWLAIWMIFEPVEPRHVGRFKIHGLFLRRQKEAADAYANVIADDIVTLSNIGEELLHGPRSDRTRQMIETAMRPAVDRATGTARSAVRVAVGTKEYDAIRETVAVEAVDYTMTPLGDEEFNKRQSEAVRKLIADSHAGDVLVRLLGDVAFGDARGRVAAGASRRRARLRRGPRPPGDLRCLSARSATRA